MLADLTQAVGKRCESHAVHSHKRLRGEDFAAADGQSPEEGRLRGICEQHGVGASQCTSQFDYAAAIGA